MTINENRAAAAVPVVPERALISDRARTVRRIVFIVRAAFYGPYVTTRTSERLGGNLGVRDTMNEKKIQKKKNQTK